MAFEGYKALFGTLLLVATIDWICGMPIEKREDKLTVSELFDELKCKESSDVGVRRVMAGCDALVSMADYQVNILEVKCEPRKKEAQCNWVVSDGSSTKTLNKDSPKADFYKGIIQMEKADSSLVVNTEYGLFSLTTMSMTCECTHDSRTEQRRTRVQPAPGGGFLE